MGFSLDVSVPVLTVFLQGLVSFFSPCVLPLIPLYIGYLSGGTGERDEQGIMHYKQSKVLVNTLFFVVGISFAFFLLGFGFTAVGSFFREQQTLFVRIGAVIIILFGLYQLGIFGSSTFLGKERRLPLPLEKMGMSPITALVMGFTFSFAWTPCVGLALASVLLMTATASTKSLGFLMIAVYTIGFVLPFLAVGFFTTSLLGFFKKHMNVVKYTVKIGAVLMILLGLLMFTGKLNGITGYLARISAPGNTASTEENADGEQNSGDEQQNSGEGQSGEADGSGQNSADGATSENEEYIPVPAIDFTLTDQYGNSHTLSDYKGKTVFLNFWATWCGPCRAEMPDIQKLYEEYQEQEDPEVVILGIAAPHYGYEGSQEDIEAFLEENEYTYPVVMDPGGKIFEEYGVYSFPTTFMIDTEGNVFGYASGQLNEDIMRDIIEQTVTGKRR